MHTQQSICLQTYSLLHLIYEVSTNQKVLLLQFRSSGTGIAYENSSGGTSKKVKKEKNN